MTLTKSMVERLRFTGWKEIDGELEDRLLGQLGTEPLPEEYSAQDLHEQVRKLVMCYDREKGVIQSEF